MFLEILCNFLQTKRNCGGHIDGVEWSYNNNIYYPLDDWTSIEMMHDSTHIVFFFGLAYMSYHFVLATSPFDPNTRYEMEKRAILFLSWK